MFGSHCPLQLFQTYYQIMAFLMELKLFLIQFVSIFYFEFFVAQINTMFLQVNIFCELCMMTNKKVYNRISMKKGQLIFISIAFFLQIYKLFHSYMRLRRYKQLIQVLKLLKPLNPSQIFQKMQKNNMKSSLQICTGLTIPAQDIYSFLKPDLKVLISHLFEGNYMAGKGNKRLINMRQPSHYIIKDSSKEIKIYETHQMIHDFTKYFKNIQISALEKIRSFIRSITNASKTAPINITTALFDNENVYELYLPCGQEYSVLADFVYQNGEICTYKPIIIAKDQYRMFLYFKSILFKKSLVMSALTIGAFICFALASYQFWKHYKEYILKKKQSNSSEIKKIIVKSRICSVCKGKLSCIFNKPCSHMPTCTQCWAQPNCLECSKAISQKIQYFVC